jgi:hypothetical protein
VHYICSESTSVQGYQNANNIAEMLTVYEETLVAKGRSKGSETAEDDDDPEMMASRQRTFPDNYGQDCLHDSRETVVGQVRLKGSSVWECAARDTFVPEAVEEAEVACEDAKMA